jgi:hypothetical protein
MYSITIDELRTAVADYVHGSRDLSRLEAAEIARIDECIRNGLRRFYYPESSGSQPHQWRFLRVNRTVDIVQGQRTTSMPPDHGGFHGPLTYDTPNRSEIIYKTSELEIRQRRDQVLDFSGVPTLYCERWVANANAAPQSLEIEFWPVPSETATAIGWSVVRPLETGIGREYPAGGPEHAMTCRLCVLAEAEMMQNGAPGAYFQSMQVALQGSIARDKTSAMPDTIGYNGRGGPSAPLSFVRPHTSVNYAG